MFSHSFHAEQAECGDCHGAQDDRGEPKVASGHAGCSDCHEMEGSCQTCHRGAKTGVKLARRQRGLRFSHAAHAATAKACGDCHPSDRRGGAVVLGHKTCNTSKCHEKTYGALECSHCHRDLTRASPAALSGLRHGPGFARSHGVEARRNVRGCVQCHDQTYCAGCHSPSSLAKASVRFPEQVAARFIHRGDYVSRHPTEARADPTSCRKCHGQRTCRACHARNGLAVSVHQDRPGARSRKPAHPPGWMVPGAAAFHGHKARLEINRCASCHDRGASSNCVQCHKVGGTGGNPHPPGWSWRDKQGQCRSTPMCRTCHQNGAGCP